MESSYAKRNNLTQDPLGMPSRSNVVWPTGGECKQRGASLNILARLERRSGLNSLVPNARSVFGKGAQAESYRKAELGFGPWDPVLPAPDPKHQNPVTYKTIQCKMYVGHQRRGKFLCFFINFDLLLYFSLKSLL